MNKIKTLIFLAFVILAVAIGVSGCNTMEGAGKDIERAGEGIQNAAD